MKSDIIILLVEPENPDNIGATCRAIKNMGFSNLRLVKPPRLWKRKGKKMAMSAGDILEKAQVYKTAEAAVEDAGLIVGTSRRQRRFKSNLIEFDEAIGKIKEQAAASHPTIIMFGKESKGLDNDSLNLCDWVTTFPANPVYPSFNLAQAVMVMVFALGKDAWQESDLTKRGPGGNWVDKKTVFEVLHVWRKTLGDLGYKMGENQVGDRIEQTMRDWIKRSGLLKREAQMLKGLSKKIRKSKNG